ncbi:MAG TPA: hypothetical protein ENG74_00660 [Thermoplasmatales archaeon]|nr:hypothetical protein [Thermoplasmatales archaeon]
MPTVSHVVRKLVNKSVTLRSALVRGIASYGAIAKQIKPDVERELGREVHHYAIVTALRRYAKETNKCRIEKKKTTVPDIDFTMRTNILYVGLLRSPSLMEKLKKLHDLVKFENGDILNIVYGRNFVSIITNDRYMKKILSQLEGEKIIRVKDDLVSLSISFSNADAHDPFTLLQAVENFAWENIDLYGVVSSEDEIIFLLDGEDALDGYETLDRWMRRNREHTP